MKGDRPDPTVPPVSPAVEALLVHERVPQAQPEMVRARAFARARAMPRELPAPASSPRPAPLRLRRPLFAAAAGITLMAGVAAAFQLMKRPAPISTTETESAPATRPPEGASPLAETGPAPAISRPSAPDRVAPAVITSPGRRPPLAGKHEVGPTEIQLLTRARQADVRGDYTDVLAILAEHQRSHPDGRLSEEREVLRVRALVGLGQRNEARRAAARFHRQFPQSVLLQKVDESLTTSP
jgi:hypothetical protein